MPVLLLTDNASFANLVSSSIDLDAWSMTLGPTLVMTRGPCEFAASAGLTFNIYSWEASQKETLDVTTATGPSEVARWADSNHGVKFRPGIYLQGEVDYSFTESIGLSGFLRLGAAQTFRVGAGPASSEIDPYGLTAGLMLRFTLP